MAYLPALIIAGASLLLLVIMIGALLGPVRRFRVALSEYRERLDAEARLLQAGRDQAREQLHQVRYPDGEQAAGRIGPQGETEERNG